MAKHKHWQNYENEVLHQKYATTNTKALVHELDRSYNSITKQASRLGLSKPRISNVLTKEFLVEEYVNNNKTIGQIGNDLGTSEYNVYEALLRHKIPIDKKGKYNGDRHHNWRGYGEISQSQFGDIRYGAKDRNIEFNITIEYLWELFLKQDRLCALSGVLLTFSASSARYWENTTASLDRINSDIGYIVGNVQWVHKLINVMKMSLSQDEFLYWCNLVSEYQKE